MATAAIFVAVVLFIYSPSAYKFFKADYSTLPPGVIAGIVASSEGEIPRLTLPDASPLPQPRTPAASARLNDVVSSSASLADLLDAAIDREGHARWSDVSELFAQMRDLDWFEANGFNDNRFDAASLVRASYRGGAASGGSRSGGGGSMNLGGEGAGGGAAGGGATDECDTCPVYGGPRLTEYSEIPLPTGGAGVIDVVFVPSSSEGSFSVEPSLQPMIPGDGDVPQFTPDVPLEFDPDPDPDAPAPVPEPATVVLTALGLGGGLIAKARARRRTS